MLFLLLACDKTDPTEKPDPSVDSQPVIDSPQDTAETTLPPRRGALIDVSLTGIVGLRLDLVPESMREDMATAFLNESEQFWLDRASVQMQVYDSYLYYRGYYDRSKGSLPLPDDAVWEIALSGAPLRGEQDGVDSVYVGFSFHTVIVSDETSVPFSDPFLSVEGGILEESHDLPLDAVSAYQSYLYIAPGAKIAPGVPIPPPVGMPSVTLTGYFERIPWDETLAAQYNVGDIHEGITQMRVVPEGLENNYIEWRYIPEDDCAIQEQCVSGSGWRRLLRFDASVHNNGTEPLHIGYVGRHEDVYTDHNVFVYSECHQHYHFSHYGEYLYETPEQTEGEKKAFCLISTSRRSNNATSPLVTDYEGCTYQGIAQGWGDDYSAYLDCQWIDVTDVDTSAGTIDAPLDFTFNPDQFLCEGNLRLGEDGNPTFSPTGEFTEDGLSIDKPDCDFVDGWDSDNHAASNVSLAPTGTSVVEACPIPMLGKDRNCAFTQEQSFRCDIGQPVQLHCTADTPAVLRICADSTLHGPLACGNSDAQETAIVDGSTLIDTLCPTGRDASEVGGAFSTFSGPIYSEDVSSPVHCEIVSP